MNYEILKVPDSDTVSETSNTEWLFVFCSIPHQFIVYLIIVFSDDVELLTMSLEKPRTETQGLEAWKWPLWEFCLVMPVLCVPSFTLCHAQEIPPGGRLSWLGITMICLSFPGKVLECNLKMGHNCFLLWYEQKSRSFFYLAKSKGKGGCKMPCLCNCNAHLCCCACPSCISNKCSMSHCKECICKAGACT